MSLKCTVLPPISWWPFSWHVSVIEIQLLWLVSNGPCFLVFWMSAVNSVSDCFSQASYLVFRTFWVSAMETILQCSGRPDFPHFIFLRYELSLISKLSLSSSFVFYYVDEIYNSLRCLLPLLPRTRRSHPFHHTKLVCCVDQFGQWLCHWKLQVWEWKENYFRTLWLLYKSRYVFRDSDLFELLNEDFPAFDEKQYIPKDHEVHFGQYVQIFLCSCHWSKPVPPKRFSSPPLILHKDKLDC